MRLQVRFSETFFVSAIVAVLECYGMIPGTGSNIDHLVQVAVTLMLIKFELECLAH